MKQQIEDTYKIFRYFFEYRDYHCTDNNEGIFFIANTGFFGAAQRNIFSCK